MFWRRRKRLDEEVQSHLAQETEDNIVRGMDPVKARNAALRTFGNVARAMESARELDPLYWLDTLWQDACFAFRLIARNRWTSATIIATLTIGIGLNVSVFSLLNRLLLRPWVRSEPETFVSLIPRFSGQYGLRFSDYAAMSQPDYERYRDSSKSLQSLAAYRTVSLTLGGEESGTLRGGLISCNLFDVMRPGPPLAGRYLALDECATPMQPAVAILSETVWRARFNADPGVVGRVIRLCVHATSIFFYAASVPKVNDTEDGRIGPDAERQGSDRRGGKPRILAQHAAGIAKVLKEGFHFE